MDDVIDGDTIAIDTRQRVRLLQIDAPETFRGAECYGRQATALLEQLLPTGTPVRLEIDPALDRVDSYGRLLRYVHKDDLNVNRHLVRAGAASVYFYRGGRGRYANQLLGDAKHAQGAKLGMWGTCPQARFQPGASVDTGAATPPGKRSSNAKGLPKAPPFPPDVDCADLKGPVDVSAGDPHRLDANNDGVGCG